MSLLACLALRRDRPLSRQQLAFMLWPDSAEAQARTNLRHLLHALRHMIPGFDDLVASTTQTLCWRSDAPVWVDAQRWIDLLDDAWKTTGDPLPALLEAEELWRGDLLEGIYDEWVVLEREMLRERRQDALARAIALLEARSQPEQALPLAERLLAQEPLDEAAYRLLMRLYDAAGNRARAVRVYHECVATLERELGIEPSAQTVEAYETLLPRERGREVDMLRRVGGPELVGRVDERRRLTTLWREAERGRASLVLVTGEPGVGKTRLVEELAAWCANRGARVAVARSYAAEGALAFGPVVAWLRSSAVYQHLLRSEPALLTDIARLLPELLSNPGGFPLPEPLPADEHRRRLFVALTGALLASEEPLLLVADDGQWCDDETLQFVHYLLRAESNARLLVAVTARREEMDHQHPLNALVSGLLALDRCSELRVERLTRAETGSLAQRYADRTIAPDELDELYRETAGNPLFIVEAVRAGWTGSGGVRTSLSPRVKAVIEARFAQLTRPAFDLLGIAATFGGALSADMLTVASEMNAHDVVLALDELWRRRILVESGADGYDFSHDKLREVAYGTLSPALRCRNHARAAATLERLQGASIRGSGQIAMHYELAGDVEHAVDWYERAAEALLQLHANAEAVRMLQRAIDLLRRQGPTPATRARELALLTALPAPLVSLEGYQSPFVSDVHARAVAVAAELEVELEPPLLWSLAVAHMSRAAFEEARPFAHQLRARAERDADHVLVVQSDYLLGILAFWTGEFDSAAARFRSVVDGSRPEDLPTHVLRYAQDPAILCQARLAYALWFLGHVAAARSAYEEVLTQVALHEHRYSRMTALNFAGLFALETGDYPRLREHVVAIRALLGEDEPPHLQAYVESLTGILMVLDGNPTTGLGRIERAIDVSRTAFPAPGFTAIMTRVQLAACWLAGDTRAGLAAADQLCADNVRTWDAEGRRMRAEFLMLGDRPCEHIRAELDKALDVARRQGARMLEMRVAMSLLRQCLRIADDDGAAHARRLLADLVAGVSGDADSADLREAATLLSAT
jgi:DNA-binding SARP family transcriptional activator